MVRSINRCELSSWFRLGWKKCLCDMAERLNIDSPHCPTLTGVVVHLWPHETKPPPLQGLSQPLFQRGAISAAHTRPRLVFEDHVELAM